MKNPKDINVSPVVWGSYVILLMLVECLQLNLKTWWDPIVSCCFNLLFYAVMSWMYCGLTSAFDSLRRPLCLLGHAVIALYAMSSLFLFVFFGRHWDALTLQFLLETNGTEAGEFVTTFLLSWRFLWIVLAFASFFAVERKLYRRVRMVAFLPQRKIGRVVVGCLCAWALSNAVFFSLNAEQNYDWAAKMYSPIKRNSVWNLWQSCCQYRDFQGEFDKCAMTQRQYHEKVTSTEKKADVVLIIGESFNRHMSNLYDGAYPTNPLLTKRMQTGRMYFFTDVIASHNGTTQNFKYFLSTASVGEKRRWCDAPLFPTVLKRAGYNVVFYSNQLVVNDNLGQWDASMGFMNHPGVSMYFQNHRNARKYPYDLQLVEDYVKHRSEIERPTQNFVMFHLYGQHVNASQRYPAAFSHFKASDVNPHYAWGPNQGKTLTQEARQQVADYLNATYYNDYVVDQIMRLFEKKDAIIIYFSDHGEEVNNFRAQYGRTDLQDDEREAMQCQLDVPFMVYMTPSYARSHASMVARLRAAQSKRFMTDDLSQFIFDLLGVKTRYFKPALSPLDSHYNTSKKRLTQYGSSYD